MNSNFAQSVPSVHGSPRRIAHLDMDAFYASVELLRAPHLQGLPVVIGGSRRQLGQPVGEATLQDYVGRGVITTCTYAARAFGVRSGMGLMKAAKLCPQAILLPVDFDEYRKYSRRFKAAVLESAPVMEDRGIDEVYLDLTDVAGDTLHVARQIQARVLLATGLTCSIGVAPNKLLAKICSDLDKPNGITILLPEDIPTRIWPLPVKTLNGVGPKANAKLAELGLHTIGEVAAADPQWLMAQFGTSYGAWLHRAAHGQDERPVVTEQVVKSVSRETTFAQDLHPRLDRAALTPVLVKLCEQVAADLLRKQVWGRTIGIKLRYHDFRTVTRDVTLALPTRNALEILQAARQCLKRVDLSRRIRLLGVRVGSLVSTLPVGEARADGGLANHLPESSGQVKNERSRSETGWLFDDV